MGKRNGSWIAQRTCLRCRVSWLGKGTCPQCELRNLRTHVAQAEVYREIYGVRLNSIFIIGKLDRKPEIRKRGETSIVRLRIENTRNEDGNERKTWVDVVWQGNVNPEAIDHMDPGTSVAIKGCLANLPMGSGKFSLGIKATEVELV